MSRKHTQSALVVLLIATLGWLVFYPVSHDGPVAKLRTRTPSPPSELGVPRPSVAVATPAPATTLAADPHEETPACSAGCSSHARPVADPADPAALAAPPSKRAWDYDFIESLTTAAVGNPIRFELTDGVFAAGTIQHLEHVEGALIRVSGKLDTPEAGRFFFQKQTIPGKQGDFAGLVEFPASKSAWRIEPSGPGGKSELVKRQLDDVMCILPPRSAAALAEEVLASPPLDPSDVPDYVPPHNDGIISLQSMPGAPGVLYIDYRGGYTTTWGSVIYEKPNITNTQIKDVWKRVAEDYMPFNINVTTDIRVFEAAAQGQRQRCIVTPTDTAQPGAGGVALVDSWNLSGDMPCWSFVIAGKSAAEVISHEVGHALGLLHDGLITPAQQYYGGQGSGAVGWAPIMGVGYSQPVAQWSKGEYTSASRTEDDLAMIVTNNNAVDYRPDDTGNTQSTARYLEVNADSTVFAEGVIETTGDTDAFRFTTTGGAVVLNANPVGDWANLAIKAELVDSTDTVLATGNIQTQLNASIAMTLPAGTYTFRITGAGRNDPLVDGFSSYGSLGYYSIGGTVTNGVPTTRLNIEEHSANGTAVGTVAATSPNPTGYTIASGNTNLAFAINSSGALTVANVAALNYETLAATTQLTVQYELFVDITYENSALNETKRVVVQVLDVNEAPGITGGSITILEHTSIGTKVLMPTFTDPDQYDLGTFSITEGNIGNAFAINSATGQITVAEDIDVTESTVYNLTVTVADQGSPALTASVVVPVTVVTITAGYTPGGIVRTYFENITANTLSDFTSNARFPNSPDSEQFLTSFDGLPHGDNFGSTIRGYLIPPVTGTYQFWVASDDDSELLLSTNESPANVSRIAYLFNFVTQYEWTRYASQQSVTRTLTAGQPYYIEARHIESTQSDYVAVAWTGPGITRQVIPGLYLAPYYQNYAPKPVAATYTVRENSVPGQAFGTVTSTDVNAQDTASGYVITGGNTGGVFAINSATGQLSVALPGLLNATTTPSYTLTIQCTDNHTPALSGSGTVTVNVLASTGINANIVQEIWSGITGYTVANLTANANYPYKSTLRRTLTSFDSGQNYADNYGSRIRVKFIPPTTDSYRFYIASDDASSLLFSTNPTGSSAAQIAYVSGYTDYNNWTDNVSQTSAVQSLTAGQAVYLEALHKEGGGGDHVQVAYTNSTVTTPTVIPGSMLMPVDTNTAPVFSPTSYSYNVDILAATVGMVVGTVTATEPNGEALTYAILSGNSQGTFAINTSTGEITVANPAGLSLGAVTLQVAAQDGGMGAVYPLATATATVVIDVIDFSAAYTITFDSAGGSAVAPITQTAGTSVTPPTNPTKTGYSFAGWSPTVPATMPTSNTTCIAQWTPDTYPVTYNGNGNSAGTTPAAQNKLHDTNLTLQTNSGNLVKTGFVFDAWNTATDGNSTNYAAGSTYTANAPITLYAKWVSDGGGTWIPTAAGPFDWSDTDNWANGIVATGADKTASFIPNMTADQVVNLDAAPIIGNILFTDSTTSSHNLTISGANTLTLDRSTSVAPVVDVTQPDRTITISSVVAGSDGLEKLGSGTLTLSGANTYTGTTTISAGTLRLEGTAFSTTARNYSITSGAVMDIASGAGAIPAGTGTGATTISGGGTLRVSGEISADADNKDLNISLGTGSTIDILSGGSITNGGYQPITWTNNKATLNVNGSLSIVDGQAITADALIGAGTITSANSGTAANFTLGVANGSGTYSGTISAAGTRVISLVKKGTGTQIFSGSTTWKGTTTINKNSGTLQYAKRNSLYAGVTTDWVRTKIIVNEGATIAFNVGGTGEFTAEDVTTLLTGLGGTVNNNGLRWGSIIAFDTSNASGGSFTIADKIANTSGTDGGSIALTKLGTGTLVLSGNNTYGYNTTVSAGTLLINGNQSTAYYPVSVAANATLGGTGTIGGNVTIVDGGKLQFNLSTPPASHDSLELTSVRTLTFSGASVLTITSSIGATIGEYTLVTGGKNIVCATLPTLNLPVGWSATVSIVGNNLKLNVTSGPVGTVASFAITGIPAQVPVGTPVTGITITAKDAANQTVTSFTGTVTFGGTAGITGTSANFVAGVLSGVSITPTAVGSNQTFTVDDGSNHTGTASFTVQTPYQSWASTNAPSGNPNHDFDGDGVPNAVEFVLGGDKNTKDISKLPTVATPGSNMTFTFLRNRNSIDPKVGVTIEVGTDLTNWPNAYTVGAVTASSTSGVTVTNNGNGTDTITLTLPQATDTKKFVRLRAEVMP